MLTTLVSVVLVALVGLFVAWPFVRPSTPAADATPDRVSPLERQKHEAYTALREAEFDFAMGKLSPDDYASLRNRYRQEALTAIAAIEDARARAKRDRPRAAAGKPDRRIAFCPSCGNRVPARANFCGGCGYSLRDLVA